jgi:hypothetical protein
MALLNEGVDRQTIQLLNEGVDRQTIQLVGRWKSDAMLCYLLQRCSIATLLTSYRLEDTNSSVELMPTRMGINCVGYE